MLTEPALMGDANHLYPDNSNMHIEKVSKFMVFKIRQTMSLKSKLN